MGAALLLWLVAVWPPPVWYRTHWPAETAFMEMRRTSSRRLTVPPSRLYRPVPIDSIAESMGTAVMIGEDNRFQSHHGVDYLAILQALGYPRQSYDWSSGRDRGQALRVVTSLWSHPSALRGASTITQQLAKNLYLSPSRNPLRKVKEALTAYRIEAAMSKQRILELYLNVVELGDEVWGVDAASRKYFARPAARLTREQAASLAGSLPFPLRSNPEYRPGRMRWRRDLILRRMQGEEVVVPRVEEETPVEPSDTLAPSPVDTLVTPVPEIDTTPAEVEVDTAPAESPDSTQ